MPEARLDRTRGADRIGLLLLGLAVVALSGCATTDAGPANTIDREETLDPGSFVEVNLAMNESAELTYRWETSNETVVGFDVHAHEDGETRYHEQTDDTQGEGSFTAPSAGMYSLFWENPSEEATTVDIHIEGSFVRDSIVP